MDVPQGDGKSTGTGVHSVGGLLIKKHMTVYTYYCLYSYGCDVSLCGRCYCNQKPIINSITQKSIIRTVNAYQFMDIRVRD